jgi:hypothetical protein
MIVAIQPNVVTLMVKRVCRPAKCSYHRGGIEPFHAVPREFARL